MIVIKMKEYDEELRRIEASSLQQNEERLTELVAS
jgi:hypothetical protein